MGQKAREGLTRLVGQYEKRHADHKSESKLSERLYLVR